MAKAQKKQVKKAEWKGYHKVNLTKEQEEAFPIWAQEHPYGLEDVERLVDLGYKVSFGYDDYHQGFTASMYCTQAKMAWAGYTLSAWAGDMVSAFYVLMYKHFEICHGEWEIAPERSERQSSSFG